MTGGPAVCGATNGTYTCQRREHENGTHRARTTTGNTPYLTSWSTPHGDVWSRIDRP